MFAVADGNQSPALSVSLSSSGERRFRCPFCPEHYSRNEKLIQHIESRHPEQCEFHCVLCQVRFVNGKRSNSHSATCVGAGVALSRPTVAQPPMTTLFQGPPPPLPIVSIHAPSAPVVSSPPHPPAIIASQDGGNPLDSLPEVDGFLDSVDRSKAIVTNVRFLLTSAGTVLGRPAASLSDAIREEVVNGVLGFMIDEGRKSERIYQITLLMRRIMEYLAELQSRTTHTFRSPKEFPAWKKVDQVNKLSNKKRKYDQRDRMAGLNESLTSKLMTEQELGKLVSGTMAVMSELEQRHLASTTALSNAEQRWYTDCLITAMLVLGLAPRQQVLRALTTCPNGAPFQPTLIPPGVGPNQSETQYEIRMSAHQSKTGQPVMLALPAELTPHLDWYRQTILPRGVGGAAYSGEVFLQRGGDARQDFSTATRAVTHVMIGRAVTAHAFRGSIATVFSDAPEAERRQLARTMNHDFDTHDRHYTHHKRIKTQDPFQQYLLKKAGEAAGVAPH